MDNPLKRLKTKEYLTDEEKQLAISYDPSHNKIFACWIATKIYEDFDDLTEVLKAIYYANALYKRKLLPNPIFTDEMSIEDIVEYLSHNAPQTTVENIDRLRRCPGFNKSLEFENVEFIVLKSKNHKNICCYAAETNKRWCIANPSDNREYRNIEMLEREGVETDLYIIVNKILPIKEPLSHVGLTIYRNKTVEELGYSDEEYIRAGRERFRQLYGGELHYTDAFLKEMLFQLRGLGMIFEAYNSDNMLILPQDAINFLGAAWENIN